MKKVLAIIAMLAIPALSMAANGLQGDCYDCHTMHNSESGAAVAMVGTATGTALSATPIANLLKLDCMACHANDPVAGDKIWNMPGGSAVPQVAHGGATGDLAGGNFSYGLTLGGNASVSKVHNVKELFAGNLEIYPNAVNPPGMNRATTTHNGIFTTTEAFDQFSCAGARGCHGTRNQDMTVNGSPVQRTGMAAISGSHHVNYDGAKDSLENAAGVHDGAKVAAGYRFIPGLKGYGNTVDRWENKSATSHNEYYGQAIAMGTGCTVCHVDGNTGSDLTTTMNVPNGSMSGFCSTCHGNFHSAGTENGTSGAFLRHPSDYVIPNSGEYAGYTAYTVTAPVARPALAAAVSATVAPGTDLVMCLSCHQAHGSNNDYILRFNYSAMTAGLYADKAASDAVGGCLACHTQKGVVQ